MSVKLREFYTPSHTPDTEEFAGAIPDWMIEAVDRDRSAIEALYQFGYAADSASKGTRKVIQYVQRLLQKVREKEVEETGLLDEPTVVALRKRVGYQWEIMRFKDIVWELQVQVNRLNGQKEEKVGGVPSNNDSENKILGKFTKEQAALGIMGLSAVLLLLGDD